MDSSIAIANLKDYIKELNKKATRYTYNNCELSIGNKERIELALEQIELYKIGKGRLN